MARPKCSVCCQAQVEERNRACLGWPGSKRDNTNEFGPSATKNQRHTQRKLPGANTPAASASVARDYYHVLRFAPVHEAARFEMLQEVKPALSDPV